MVTFLLWAGIVVAALFAILVILFFVGIFAICKDANEAVEYNNEVIKGLKNRG